jgi:hypothetical protein
MSLCPNYQNYKRLQEFWRLAFAYRSFRTRSTFFFAAVQARSASALHIAVKVSGAKDYPFIVTASLTEKVSVKKDSFDSTYSFCYWSLVEDSKRHAIKSPLTM